MMMMMMSIIVLNIPVHPSGPGSIVPQNHKADARQRHHYKLGPAILLLCLRRPHCGEVEVSVGAVHRKASAAR